jgi:hypothetical protein
VIEITAIRLVGGDGHEHITDLLWCSTATAAGHSTLEGLVEWLSSGPKNLAVILDGSAQQQVEVVRPAGQLPYVRARVDGFWTDDLLSLPTF